MSLANGLGALNNLQKNNVIIYMNSLKVTLIKINELVNEVDGVMKKRSIQKLLHEVGRHKWKQLSRPKLPGIHAIKRLQWAREYENYTLKIGLGSSGLMSVQLNDVLVFVPSGSSDDQVINYMKKMFVHVA